MPNLYSVTDQNLSKADAIEIKIGQGTKPGMGGHLPRKKVTEEIAKIRGKPVGVKIAAGHIEEDLPFTVSANPDFVTIDGRGGRRGLLQSF